MGFKSDPARQLSATHADAPCRKDFTHEGIHTFFFFFLEKALLTMEISIQLGLRLNYKLIKLLN